MSSHKPAIAGAPVFQQPSGCNAGNHLPYPCRWSTVPLPSPPSPSARAATAGRRRGSSPSSRRCAPAAASSRRAGASACRARAPTSLPAAPMRKACATLGGPLWPGRGRQRPRPGRRKERCRTRPDHQLPKRHGSCQICQVHQLPRRQPSRSHAGSPLTRWPGSRALPAHPSPCVARRQLPDVRQPMAPVEVLGIINFRDRRSTPGRPTFAASAPAMPTRAP
jgi:hypothetical protein